MGVWVQVPTSKFLPVRYLVCRSDPFFFLYFLNFQVMRQTNEGTQKFNVWGFDSPEEVQKARAAILELFVFATKVAPEHELIVLQDYADSLHQVSTTLDDLANYMQKKE